MASTAHEQDHLSKNLDGNPFADPAWPLTVHVRLERWDGDNATQVGSAPVAHGPQHVCACSAAEDECPVVRLGGARTSCGGYPDSPVHMVGSEQRDHDAHRSCLRRRRESAADEAVSPFAPARREELPG